MRGAPVIPSARVPIARLASMLSERNDEDAVIFRPIDERERDVLEKNASRAGARGRSGERKDQRT